MGSTCKHPARRGPYPQTKSTSPQYLDEASSFSFWKKKFQIENTLLENAEGLKYGNMFSKHIPVYWFLIAFPASRAIIWVAQELHNWLLRALHQEGWGDCLLGNSLTGKYNVRIFKIATKLYVFKNEKKL